MVFEVKDLAPDEEWMGWDGRQKEQILPNGVFVYQLSLVRVDGEEKIKAGEILLLK